MVFYSGLVAELYAALRAHDPDPEPYARFVAAHGEPALELGCGDGDPLLDLLARGLDVEGVDVSQDMLDRARARAAERGLQPVLHRAAMESMELGRRYRSVFLAGATFCLLDDDAAALAALGAVARHLEPGGAVLVPLFVPPPEGAVAGAKEVQRDDGVLLRVTPLRVDRDEAARVQSTLLRYERHGAGEPEVLERAWRLHWYTPDGFAGLAAQAGLRVVRTTDLGPGSWSVVLRHG